MFGLFVPFKNSFLCKSSTYKIWYNISVQRIQMKNRASADSGTFTQCLLIFSVPVKYREINTFYNFSKKKRADYFMCSIISWMQKCFFFSPATGLFKKMWFNNNNNNKTKQSFIFCLIFSFMEGEIVPHSDLGCLLLCRIYKRIQTRRI